MLRKMFVFAILAIAALGFAGCNSSSDDAPIIILPEPIEGTYDVTYFGTLTSPFPGYTLLITNSCSKSEEMGISNGSQACELENAFSGEVVVSSGADKKIQMISKVQMDGGFMLNVSPEDKFQYTEYSAVTPAVDRLSGNGVGVVGYNMDKTTAELVATGVSFADSPFEFELKGDELTIKMTLKGKVTPIGPVDAVTIVKAKKRSKAVDAPNKNKFWAFKADNSLMGMYKVDVFATNTDGKIVTNSCEKAIASGFATVANCGTDNQTVKLEGTVAINVSSTPLYGVAAIYAKVQMNGGAVEANQDDKYQRIQFGPMPGSMVSKSMAINYLDGTSGTPDSNVETYQESPYSIVVSDNGNALTIEATLIGKDTLVNTKRVNVKYLIKATKTSTTYTALNNALLYTFE